MVWFLLFDRPGAGSDANSGKTKAVLSEDGTHYKITGQKNVDYQCRFLSLMIVFARIENDKNITGFIVENDPNNGITMNEEEHKLGIRVFLYPTSFLYRYQSSCRKHAFGKRKWFQNCHEMP